MSIFSVNVGSAPGPTRTRAEVEADLNIAYAAYPFTDLGLAIKRNDGLVYEFYSGVYSTGSRVGWKSTSKAVNNIIVAHQASKNNINLSDKIINLVPGFSNTSFGGDITIEHAMDFVDGLSDGSMLNGFTDFATYEAAIKALPDTDVFLSAPGTQGSFKYSNAGLCLMGLATMYGTRWNGSAVVKATSPTDPLPLPTWLQIAEDFENDTGLILNVEFIRPQILTNLKRLTCLQYVELMTALRDKTILTPALCDKFFQAGPIDSNTSGDGGYSNWGLGPQDLRYSKGIWQWQDNAGTWDPNAPQTQWTTIGLNGDNCWIDADFVYANVLPYDSNGATLSQLYLMKDNEALIREWALTTT